MGLFEYLRRKYFTPQQNAQSASHIPSVMPPTAILCIQNGQLPQINTGTVFMSNGEYVHFIEKAILITEKNVITGYTGSSTGWSFRVMKGVSLRTGNRRGTPIRENVQESTKGILYITSNRVIFVAKKNGFDRKISAISAVLPFSNGMGFQFGNITYSIMLPDGNLAFSVIHMLKP